MTQDGMMIGVVIGAVNDATIDHMNKITNDWFMRAARGECEWVCPDCCQSFPDGMPDQCQYGHKGCTDCMVRDKQRAKL